MSKLDRGNIPVNGKWIPNTKSKGIRSVNIPNEVHIDFRRLGGVSADLFEEKKWWSETLISQLFESRETNEFVGEFSLNNLFFLLQRTSVLICEAQSPIFSLSLWKCVEYIIGIACAVAARIK